MTTATNWLLNFALAYATPYMVNEGKGYANLQSKVFFVSYICALFNAFEIMLTFNADLGLFLLPLRRAPRLLASHPCSPLISRIVLEITP